MNVWKKYVESVENGARKSAADAGLTKVSGYLRAVRTITPNQLGVADGIRRRRRRPGMRRPPVSPPLVMVAAALVFTVTAVVLGAASTRRGSSSAGCPADGLTVVAAPDIAGPLTELAGEFAKDPGRVCSQVKIKPQPAVDVVDAFANGWDEKTYGPYPDVWVPDSSVWPRILQARRPAGTSTRPDGERAVWSGPPVAYSPLVLALPEWAATELGWAANPPTWSELVELLAAPDGWGALGHADWGTVGLAVADSKRSTAGIGAVIALAAAILGWEDEDYLPSIAASNLALVERLRNLHGMASLTAPDNRGLLTLAGKRPAKSKVTLQIVSERDVLSHNFVLARNPALSQGPDAPTRLTAIYPPDGAPLSDYPYLLVGADRMPAGVRAAAAEFIRFLDAPESRDRLVGNGFRRGLASEGMPFTASNGLEPVPPRSLLPVTGGKVISHLIAVWNRPGFGE
jgi:Ca-activated chloride channel family protein